MSFLTLFLFSIPAFAAEIEMEYSLGFDGRFRLNRWTPITVRLENRGRGVNGRLEVAVISGNEFLGNIRDTVYSVDVELPNHSNKLSSFAVLIDSFAHPLTIRFIAAGETLLSETINLRTHYTTLPLILVSGDKISPDDLPVLPESARPVFTYAKFLPETWYGYDGADTVILHVDVLKTLRKQQFEALIAWIRSGGYLITAGGLNIGSFSDQRIRDLLPVTIAGFHQTQQLRALEAFCGHRLESAHPFLILNAALDGADVLLQEEEVALILRKRYGFGQVVLLGFDFLRVPFRNWPGRHAFWQKMLEHPPAIDRSTRPLSFKKIRSTMMSAISAGFLSVKYIIPCLGLYVILLKMCFIRLEKADSRRKARVALLSVIIIFSTAGGLLLFSELRQKTAGSNSFLRLKVAGHDEIATGSYTIGVYSFQQQEHIINFSPDTYPLISIKQKQHSSGILPDSASDMDKSALTLHETAEGHRVSVHAERWSAQFLQSDTMIRFPLQGSATLEKRNLVLRFENQTAYTITDCWFYFSEHLFPLGDLPPNTRLEKTLTVSDIEQAERLTPQTAGELARDVTRRKGGAFIATMQATLSKDLLLSVYNTYHSQPDTVYLFGWVAGNMIPVRLTDAETQIEGVTLIEWEIPVRKNQV